jgi:hypothetical protein
LEDEEAAQLLLANGDHERLRDRRQNGVEAAAVPQGDRDQGVGGIEVLPALLGVILDQVDEVVL